MSPPQAEQLQQELSRKASQQQQLQQHLADLQQRLGDADQRESALRQQLADKDAQLLQLHVQQTQAQAQVVASAGAAAGKEEAAALRHLIVGLQAQLETVTQQQQASSHSARLAAAAAETEAAQAAAAAAQQQLQEVQQRLVAAVDSQTHKATELSFLQRQFEDVTTELHQQQGQVCGVPRSAASIRQTGGLCLPVLTPLCFWRRVMLPRWLPCRSGWQQQAGTPPS